MCNREEVAPLRNTYEACLRSCSERGHFKTKERKKLPPNQTPIAASVPTKKIGIKNRSVTDNKNLEDAKNKMRETVNGAATY